MSRFFAPKEGIKGDEIFIGGQEARHIYSVMRLSVNDKVVVFDGTGNEYVGFIKTSDSKAVVVKIIETRIPHIKNFPDVTLVQAIPKKEKMAHIVEKATELGVKEIWPIISERTVVMLDSSRAGLKVQRWQRIATAASKQCGRLDIPDVRPVTEFAEILDKISDFDLALFACLSDDSMKLKDALAGYERGTIVVFIGPEGDFSPVEIEEAWRHSNCKTISLGKNVLKSDTAGLYVLSCLNYELS